MNRSGFFLLTIAACCLIGPPQLMAKQKRIHTQPGCALKLHKADDSLKTQCKACTRQRGTVFVTDGKTGKCEGRTFHRWKEAIRNQQGCLAIKRARKKDRCLACVGKSGIFFPLKGAFKRGKCTIIARDVKGCSSFSGLKNRACKKCFARYDSSIAAYYSSPRLRCKADLRSTADCNKAKFRGLKLLRCNKCVANKGAFFVGLHSPGKCQK